MTDTNEDRLEEIKGYIGWKPDNELRKKFISTTIPQAYLWWAVDKIESLAKKNAELKQKLEDCQNRNLSYIANNVELKAGYKKAIEEVRELAEAKGKLGAENAKLRDRLKWYKAITDADWETLKEFSEAVARGDK